MDSTRLDYLQSSRLSQPSVHDFEENARVFAKIPIGSEAHSSLAARNLDQLGPTGSFVSFGTYNFQKDKPEKTQIVMNRSKNLNYLSNDSSQYDVHQIRSNFHSKNGIAEKTATEDQDSSEANLFDSLGNSLNPNYSSNMLNSSTLLRSKGSQDERYHLEGFSRTERALLRTIYEENQLL